MTDQEISSRPSAICSLQKSVKPSLCHNKSPRYTSPKWRNRSTVTRLMSTVAHEGGSSSCSKSCGFGRGLPARIRLISSQPIRSSLSRPGSLPIVATILWRGLLTDRIDSTFERNLAYFGIISKIGANCGRWVK
jgi:hypothetical protein